MSALLLNSSLMENVNIKPPICVDNNNKLNFQSFYYEKTAQNYLFPIENDNESKTILAKYFSTWLNTVRYRKTEQANEKRLSEFLNGLISEKQNLNSRTKSNETFTENKNDAHKTPSVHLNNLYKKRFTMQKNMIAYQRAKIEEQQRYIEALKLNKIIENITPPEVALKDIRQFLSKCDLSVKPKLKQIAGDGNANDEDDEPLVLNCMKVPKFLQKMEKRAREREEKWAIVKERRRQIELEKERLKEQAIISKQIFDQQEKLKRLNELKEQRRQDQLKAIRAKEFREKMRALAVVADLHFEKKLMQKYGLFQWMAYVKRIRDNYEFSIIYYRRHLMENHFKHWRSEILTIIATKNSNAINLYESKLKIRCFDELKKVLKTMISKRQVAEDWYDLKITEQLFELWKSNARRLKDYRNMQLNIAKNHYNRKLLWRIMGLWECLPKINSIEREKELRKQKWRMKVLEVLPDYIPKYYD